MNRSINVNQAIDATADYCLESVERTRTFIEGLYEKSKDEEGREILNEFCDDLADLFRKIDQIETVVLKEVA